MRTRLSICARKVRYGSGDEALAAALAATVQLRPYQCDRCRRWHLTSRLKGKRPLRSARRAQEERSAVVTLPAPG